MGPIERRAGFHRVEHPGVALQMAAGAGKGVHDAAGNRLARASTENMGTRFLMCRFLISVIPLARAERLARLTQRVANVALASANDLGTAADIFVMTSNQ